ncbi:MAG: lysoplasmalogenase [Thermoleophilia bacterium]
MLYGTERRRRRYWLLALLLVWGLLLVGGFVFGPGGHADHRMSTWTRIGSSLTLVTLAWSQWVFARRRRSGRFALLLAVGMTFGFVGDLVLAGILPGGRNVLGGIAAFGLGHVFYISAVVGWSRMVGLDSARARWSALAGWLVVGGVAWYFVVFRGQAAGVLHWAALPCALLLSGTAGVATGLALQVRAFAPMALGAALFLASDLILAAQLFNDVDFRLIGDVIWLTYGSGQMLIVTAVGVAWGRAVWRMRSAGVASIVA